MNSSQLHSGSGTLRSFGDLKKSHIEWQAAGGDSKNAKLYNNVIHQPVFDERCDNLEVLDILPPPELHLLLGIVYTLCKGKSCFFKI